MLADCIGRTHCFFRLIASSPARGRAGRRKWRRIEIAEEALVTAYNARAAMSTIRHPAIMAGEGATRQREDGESEALSLSRDREFITLER
jgi:hypothetical protein